MILEQMDSKAARERRIQAWRNAYHAKGSGAKLSHWDYQWGFVKLSQHMLVIVPNVNLIANIGFDSDATHCNTKEQRFKRFRNFIRVPRHKLTFPIQHPSFVIQDTRYDKCFYQVFAGSWFNWQIRRAKKAVKRWLLGK